MHHRLVLAAALAATCAAPLAAEPVPAPVLQTPSQGEPIYGQLQVQASEDWEAPERREDLLRIPMLAGKPAAMFGADSALVKGYLANPQSYYAALSGVAGADGRLTGCALRYPNGRIPDAAALCAALTEGIRFQPALDEAGKPIAQPVAIGLSARAQRGEKAGVVPALFSDQVVASPAPPAPPPPVELRAGAFPPSSSWALRHISVPKMHMAPVAPADLPPDATGLVWGAKESAWPGCHVIANSSDAIRDLSVCNYVARKLKPEWDAAVPPSKHLVALLAAGPKGAPLVAVADPALASYAKLDAASAPVVAAQVGAIIGPQPLAWGESFAARLTVGSDGRATGCTVVTGSGDDARDIAACRALRDTARFAPMRDVFGRPVGDVSWYWEASRQGVPVKP